MKFSLLNPRGLKGRYLPFEFNASRVMYWIMRVSLAYTIILIFSFSLAAKNGNGQDLEKIIVTVELQQDNLAKLVQQITSQTEIQFIYDPATTSNHQISIAKGKRSVKATLDLALVGTGLNYFQNGSYVVISQSKIEAAIPLMGISGKILSSTDNSIMAGVNVVIKGTATGTTSDANGIYTINAREDETLIFSFIGFKTAEIPINGRSQIDVVLEEDIASLNAVTIHAGYYDVNSREQTGNIAKLSSKDIQNQPVTNPLQAMEGRLPGVYINQQTGVPGGSISIKIRGQNSLRSDGNDPMYIVDGVPFTATPLSSTVIPGPIPGASPLNNINPSDIESIEVLKDADATAIYGSRGANGVILITTKKGTQGKTKVDINISKGFGQVSRMIDLLDTKQYLEMRKEGFKNDNYTPTAAVAADILEWDTTRNTNWQEEIIGGTAETTNAQVSFSGGNEYTQFIFGGGAYKETTVFPGDFGFKKGTGHFNLNHQNNTKKFTMSISSSFTSGVNKLPPEDYTRKALVLPPTAPPIYNENGELNWTDWFNQFASLKNKYEVKTDNLIANATIGYEIVKNLKIKSSMGFTLLQLSELQTNTLASQHPLSNSRIASAYFANSRIRTWIVEPQLTYDKTIGQGKLNFIIGSTFQDNFQSGVTTGASGFSNDALIENMGAASTVTLSGSNYTQYRYNAFFGRINYNWDGKYIINLTGRRDGSSRFGPDKRFANFGAVGLAWIFTKEAAFENIGGISFGKLRASYGTTGNDQIPDYGYLDSYYPTGLPYENKPGIVPTQLPNADYSWESNKKLEAALELGFLEDKIFLSTSWYRNRSSNQLVGYGLSSVTGFSSIQSNLPAVVQNTGFEFELVTRNIDNDNIRWITSINLSAPRNKLVSYPNIEKSSYANTKVVGKSLNISKAYHYLNVNPETGLYTYEDITEDGSIKYPDDLQAIKVIGQKYFGGIQNSIQYKGIQLDFLFQFVKQTGRNYISGPFNTPGIYGRFNYSGNQPEIVMNRWQNPGDETTIQRFAGNPFSSPAISSYNVKGDMVYSDASFIRLKNVSISWQLPNTITQKARISSAKVYIQCQNLLTITNYIGDPEIQNPAALPTLRVITAGLQISL